MSSVERNNAAAARLTASKGTPVGRLQVTFRVAVVGPSSVEPSEYEAIDGAIEGELRRLAYEAQRQGTSTTPVNFAVVSSLSEGVPRIAALAAIRLGATLEVILSGSIGQVSRGLSQYSRGEFQTLFKAASSTTVLAPRRPQYEQYNAIISRCDALVDVHFGADPSGQVNEIANVAKSRNLTVIDLAIEKSPKEDPAACKVVSSLTPTPLLDIKVLQLIDRFNRYPIPKDSLRSYDNMQHLQGLPTVEAVAATVVPYQARADYTALRCQRAFKYYSNAVQVLAAAATIFALTELTLLPGREFITWAETASLVLVVVSVLIGRRAGWHDMWQSCRYLAERLRWVIFIAATGASEPLAPQAASGRDQPPDWIRRAFSEIWLMIPQKTVTDAAVPLMRTVITDFLGSIISYRQRVSARLRQRERRLRVLGVILFGAGLGLAIMHSLGSYDPLHTAPQNLGYLSVLVPIISGVIAESSGRQNYGRRADEYIALTRELIALRQAVISTTEIRHLQDYVLRSEFIARPNIRREGITELEIPT
jgi:hypothetical protein